MNEHELDLTLGAIVQRRTQVTAPPILREQVRSVPFQTPERRSWLPPLTGRFQSMFSATKFVVAGAIVALFGGFLLAGVLTQQEGSGPGATADAAARGDGAVRVTGQVLDSDYFQAPVLGPGAEDFGRTEMSDERLSGDVTFIIDGEILHPATGGEMFLYWGTMVIENDGGTWMGTHLAAEHHGRPDVQDGPVVMQLVGSGDYEGLSAILYWTVVGDPALSEAFPDMSLDGMIFPGVLPPDRVGPE